MKYREVYIVQYIYSSTSSCSHRVWVFMITSQYCWLSMLRATPRSSVFGPHQLQSLIYLIPAGLRTVAVLQTQLKRLHDWNKAVKMLCVFSEWRWVTSIRDVTITVCVLRDDEQIFTHDPDIIPRQRQQEKVGGGKEGRTQMKRTRRRRRKWVKEKEQRERGDINNTNRKLVSTAKEATSLHVVTTFVSHCLLLLLALVFIRQNFPFTYLKGNKSGQTQYKVHTFNHK